MDILTCLFDRRRCGVEMNVRASAVIHSGEMVLKQYKYMYSDIYLLVSGQMMF